jgi:DNA-binding NarL/FixJ family response regulator
VAAEKLPCIDVFLLAENRLLREALARVLGSKDDIRVVAAVALDETLISRITELQPKILALDSSVFARAALELIPPLFEAVPNLKIISLGMDNDKDTFLRCVRAGISGYLLKEASANEVACAVRTVAEDGAVCPPNLCNILFQQMASASARLYRGKAKLGLTRREQQLAKMIGLNLSNKEIANQLNLSEQTVKNHIHRMLRKLGASDRLSALEMCRVEGVVA